MPLMAEFVRMPSTMWTAISLARKEGKPVLDDLVRKYRSPVLAFIRNAGFSPEEAEDLTQEVFMTIVKDDILAKADRDKGKFRSLVLAVAKQAMSAKRRHEGRIKRGGDARHVSIDPVSDDDSELKWKDLLSAPEKDEKFDFLWIRNLVRIGMNRLKEENPRYFEALLMVTDEELSYEDVAQKMDAAVTDVKNWTHQARQKLKRHVLKEVQDYSSTRDEYDSEVAYLMKFLD